MDQQFSDSETFNTMKVCILGDGASGWIACHTMAALPYVDEVIIIGSSKIPSIGVGESTTMATPTLHAQIGIDEVEFVKNSDAVMKYGVMYSGWGGEDFIHHFKCEDTFRDNELDMHDFFCGLGKKPKHTNINDLVCRDLYETITQNKVFINSNNSGEYYKHAWHFDAGKYIAFLHKHSEKNPKITFIDAKVIGCRKFDVFIKDILIEGDIWVEADYYINTLGDTKLNSDIFGEEYDYYTDVLLANRAVACPLQYKNKATDMHPYTIAKTLKHGWRWITPTYSRIGTGLVFSTNHVSEDEAIATLCEDIGDFDHPDPFSVDFTPRIAKQIFKNNSVILGMAGQFLEPLDAPGLAASAKLLEITCGILHKYSEAIKHKAYEEDYLEEIRLQNMQAKESYQWWCTFILSQYKTVERQDSQFWIDHKNVEFDFYDDFMHNISNLEYLPHYEKEMIWHTMAGKNIQWGSNSDLKEIEVPKFLTMRHISLMKFYRGSK